MRDVVNYKPKLSKEARAIGQTAKIESGRMVNPEEVPWLDELRREVTAFPNGRHDDQVDSMVQFLGWIDTGVGHGFMNRDPLQAGQASRPVHSTFA